MDVFFSTYSVGLQETVALAAVALIGYLFGHRTRQRKLQIERAGREVELDRASRIAHHLERVAASLRRELATHHTQVGRFKRRLREVQQNGDRDAWSALCNEADAIMQPTLLLAGQLSQAYDKIRQQSHALLTFTEGRVDPVTGVGNVRALEEQLHVLLPTVREGEAPLSVALVGVDITGDGARSSRRGCNEQLLQEVAAVVQTTMRDADFVARYGADEFVVLMPKTNLAGANIFGERLRKLANQELPVTLSCGVAVAASGDTIKALLARADSALYSAKAAGCSRQFFHNGAQIREYYSPPTNEGDDSAEPLETRRTIGAEMNPFAAVEEQVGAQSGS